MILSRRAECTARHLLAFELSKEEVYNSTSDAYQLYCSNKRSWLYNTPGFSKQIGRYRKFSF